MRHVYDILIVGAGPAGLTAAWQAAAAGVERILLIDAGPDLPKRRCPALSARVCPSCRHCGLLQGVGGASGIVGGKLCYFPAGARLAQHVGHTSAEANSAVVDLLKSLGLELPVPFENTRADPAPRSHSDLADLELRAYQAFPVLADGLRPLFDSLRAAVIREGVELKADTKLLALSPGRGTAAFHAKLGCARESFVVTVNRAVVLATGRSTSPWLFDLMTSVGVAQEASKVDIGIRLECDASRLADLLVAFEDPKLVFRRNTAREIRTLCWCRGGSMTVTSMAGYQLIDGHFGHCYSDRTSVSVVARRPVPLGVQPLAHAAELAAYEPGHIPMRSRLSEFVGSSRCPHRSLRVIGPCHTRPMEIGHWTQELLDDLRDFVSNLDTLSDRRLLDDPSAVVYGPVIDNQWPLPTLDKTLQTSVNGLYIAGDVQGRARGVIQAMFSGLIVSHAIAGTSVSASDVPFARTRQ